MAFRKVSSVRPSGPASAGTKETELFIRGSSTVITSNVHTCNVSDSMAGHDKALSFYRYSTENMLTTAYCSVTTHSNIHTSTCTCIPQLVLITSLKCTFTSKLPFLVDSFQPVEVQVIQVVLDVLWGVPGGLSQPTIRPVQTPSLPQLPSKHRHTATAPLLSSVGITTV